MLKDVKGEHGTRFGKSAYFCTISMNVGNVNGGDGLNPTWIAGSLSKPLCTKGFCSKQSGMSNRLVTIGSLKSRNKDEINR